MTGTIDSRKRVRYHASDIPDLRERMRAMEVNHEHLSKELSETRDVLRETKEAMLMLKSSFDAVTNQGKGAKIVVNGFLALGGLGWLGGLYSIVQQLMAAAPKH